MQPGRLPRWDAARQGHHCVLYDSDSDRGWTGWLTAHHQAVRAQLSPRTRRSSRVEEVVGFSQLIIPTPVEVSRSTKWSNTPISTHPRARGGLPDNTPTTPWELRITPPETRGRRPSGPRRVPNIPQFAASPGTGPGLYISKEANPEQQNQGKDMSGTEGAELKQNLHNKPELKTRLSCGIPPSRRVWARRRSTMQEERGPVR